MKIIKSIGKYKGDMIRGVICALISISWISNIMKLTNTSNIYLWIGLSCAVAITLVVRSYDNDWFPKGKKIRFKALEKL